jgi:ABC-2 type transport system permease protein
MTEPAGSIYDLGYRNYQGARLGRGYAVLALYLSTLRSAFGLGRRAWSKVFPIGLAALAFLPAVVQLGVGALVPGEVDVFRAEDYYGYVQVIIVLFCAAAGPEVVARDQRNRTLSLYFSRALLRSDYALAKAGAFATALLFLTLGPQLLMYVGNAMSTDDVVGYFEAEWDEFGPIVLSALLISTFLGSITLAIACQSSRRAYTTVAIIALAIVTAAIAGIMGEIASETATAIAVLFSPFDVVSGATYWIFGADLPSGEALDHAGMPGWIYVLASLSWTMVGLAVLVRRYARIDA